MAAPTVTVMIGDARKRLKELPGKSVQLIVTSVPYLGMRDYSLCRCTLRGDEIQKADPNCRTCHGTGQVPGVEELQIGREPTIAQWLEGLREVFRECWRVLRDDGMLMVNVGDCWNGENGFERADDRFRGGGRRGGSGDKQSLAGLHDKDLVGQPWRVAFMLQDDGWILRFDIIWEKTNVMSGSATDRPTRNHEYIFQFSKQGRYYYDDLAEREPLADSTLRVGTIPRKSAGGQTKGERFNRSLKGRVNYVDGRKLRGVWKIPARASGVGHYATFPLELAERCIRLGTSERGACAGCNTPWKRVIKKEWGKPRARVQTTQTDWIGVGKAHRPGGLNTGEYPRDVRVITLGWEPACECNGTLVARRRKVIEMGDWAQAGFSEAAGILNAQRKQGNSKPREVMRTVIEYESDLPIEQHPIVPCMVLDPFAGSGTTGSAARHLGRSAILVELNPQYVEEDMPRRADTLTKPLEVVS